MTTPPSVLKKVPITLIPPFVPFGTFLKVVTKYGSELEKTVPSSDAQVSPLQQEKTPANYINLISIIDTF